MLHKQQNATKMTNFKEEIKNAIISVFPNSMVNVRLHKGLGEPSILIQFTIGKDSSQYPHSIINNDDYFATIWIYGVDSEGNLIEGKTLSVESESAKRVTRTATEKYMAFGRLKTKWRNFKTAKPQDVVKKIYKHFISVDELMKENFSVLTPHTQAILNSWNNNYSVGGL